MDDDARDLHGNRLLHEPLSIPAAMVARFKDWTISLAYSGGPDSATWRLRRSQDIRYFKVARSGREPSLAEECDRTRWAAGRLPVPRVVDYGIADGIEWMLTEDLSGVSTTDKLLTENPTALVPLLAHGLRVFHETPSQDCPFRFCLNEALILVRRRVERGLVDAARLQPEHRHMAPAQALAKLEAERPTTEDVVLCHGDYCLPNVLVDAGRISGYVDLGGLALADRWWDLSVATWSVTWNLGPGWEDVFLKAYGIDADPERMRYFRLLYDLAS